MISSMTHDRTKSRVFIREKLMLLCRPLISAMIMMRRQNVVSVLFICRSAETTAESSCVLCNKHTISNSYTISGCSQVKKNINITMLFSFPIVGRLHVLVLLKTLIGIVIITE